MRSALASAWLFAATSGIAAAAATPTPAPVPTLNAQQFNARLKSSLQHHVLPTPRMPTQPLHVVLVVETNRKGQVTRVRYNGSKSSNDDTFNAMAYGNALQAFIRTEDGKAVAGTFRLIYDYSPDTQHVHRTVELVAAGGVDPNAISAVQDMAKQNMHKMDEDRAAWEAAVAKARAAKASPKPTSSPH